MDKCGVVVIQLSVCFVCCAAESVVVCVGPEERIFYFVTFFFLEFPHRKKRAKLSSLLFRSMSASQTKTHPAQQPYQSKALPL